MKNIMGTVVLIASIAIIVALMFLVPKGFQLGDPEPIASASDIDKSAD
jgi:hypothetical protein